MSRHVVKVWFGNSVICRQVYDEDMAARYEAAMRRRFACCRVTNVVVGGGGAQGGEPVHGDRLTTTGVVS